MYFLWKILSGSTCPVYIDKIASRGCKYSFRNNLFISGYQQKKFSTLKTEGPSQFYAEKVASGILTPDEHQNCIIEDLQRIFDEVS